MEQAQWLAAFLLMGCLLATGNGEKSMTIQLSVRPENTDASQMACNLMAIKVNSTGEVIYLKEMTSSFIRPTAQQQSPTNDDRMCFYQEIYNNPSRLVTVSAMKNIINVFISWGGSAYNVENGNLTESLQGITLEPYNTAGLDLSHHSGGNCGVRKTAPQSSHSYTPKTEALLNYVNNTITNYYVELYMVADRDFYLQYGNNTENVIYQIINNVNAMYRPEGIYVLLVGLEVWKTADRMNMTLDAVAAIESLKNYRTTLTQKHDSIHLVSSKPFTDEILGIAYTPGICNYQYSAAISSDNKTLTSVQISTTVAHELGHTFGLIHDTADCNCLPEVACIMNTTATNFFAQKWSNCSRNTLQTNLKIVKAFQCLQDNSNAVGILNSNICGNGVVEGEEDCDPGAISTNSTCCDPVTCKFRAGATCASGRCCDKTTCRPFTAGTACRPITNECDLPEYCDGIMEHCPDDRSKLNGVSCDNTKGYCYQGFCSSHNIQCQLIMGTGSTTSSNQCYTVRNVNTTLGYCSYVAGSSPTQSTACTAANALCGQLQCTSFGADRVDWFTANNYTVNGETCYSSIFDTKLSYVRDPLLVPNGAKCGTNQWCMNSVCQSLPTTTCSCNSRGVCNDLGHCHCDSGYSGLDCSISSGCGGSVDSGPPCANQSATASCPPNYCQNGGTCILNTNGLQCLIGAPFCCRCPGNFLEPKCDKLAVRSAQVSITSNITFINDYSYSGSSAFKEFEKAACQLIRLAFRRTFGHTQMNCQVGIIRKGSAIGTAVVKGDSNLSNSSVSILKALTQFCNLTDNPSNVSCNNAYIVSPSVAIPSAALDSCATADCSVNADCKVIDAINYNCTCKQMYTDVSSSPGYPGRVCTFSTTIIIIIVVVVGGSLIILAIIIVIIIVVKKKQSKVKPNDKQDDANTKGNVVIVTAPEDKKRKRSSPPLYEST